MDVPVCPNSKLSPHPKGTKNRRFVRRGFFYRTSDRRYVRRYQCNFCRKHFSTATFDPDFGLKRRDIHKPVYEGLVSGVSQRRLSRLLEVDLKTIARKLKLLGIRALAANAERRAHLRLEGNRIAALQFDELETFEHTKMKPVSVALIVKKDTREIISAQVAQMPAKGLIAANSIKKYGKRRDHRKMSIAAALAQVRGMIAAGAVFESDENPMYPELVKECLPGVSHVRHPGKRGAITGQGELKKVGFDPLFSLNHSCAMLRANINRLFRKTWCTTKKLPALVHHIALYQLYHNEVLISDPSTSLKDLI
jgi:transposase-like protein